MDVASFFSLLAFSISFLTLNVLGNLIRHYIAHQPPGSLSLYVATVRDINIWAQIQGSAHCFLGALSRFEIVQDCFRSNSIFSDFICTIYELAATTLVVHVCAFCLIRMLCLSNATFMEETVGERMTRVIVACVSILASAGVCASLVVSGEIHTGSIFSLMTQQFVPGGSVRKIIHPTLYASLVISYLTMELYIKWKIWRQKVDGIEIETNLNKSGPVSMSLALALILHTLSDFTLPKLIKGPEYFLAKVLISNLIFFITVPTIVIWNNPNIHKFVKQALQSKIPKIFKKVSTRISPAASHVEQP